MDAGALLGTLKGSVDAWLAPSEKAGLEPTGKALLVPSLDAAVGVEAIAAIQ